MLNKQILSNTTAGYCWDLKTKERINNPLYLEGFGYKVYSQNDEDGIIHEIFKRLGISVGRFIEFGVQDGLESNTHCLLHYGWKGMWIEGSKRYCHSIKRKFHHVIESGQLKVVNAFVDKNNINQIFVENGFSDRRRGGGYRPVKYRY